MSHSLRGPANVFRRVLIATGLDRVVAEATHRTPDGLIARLFRPDISLYRRPTVRRATRNGIHYELDLSDYVEWTIYYGVERNLKSILYRLVLPTQTVIDVGTNVGEVLLNFGRVVGPDGRAIGFEPNPATLAKCRRNLALNDLQNLDLFGLALGAEAGEVILSRPAETNAGADRVVHSGRDGITVQITTLDLFIEKLCLQRIDLIKIDVEGFELNVLRGAERAIERFKPVFFVELSDSNLVEQGDNASKMLRWLEDRGYQAQDAVTGDAIRSTDRLDGCFRDVIARIG